MTTIEAKIQINGVSLTEGESMTVRVAMSNFLSSVQEGMLGDDEHGKAMTELYERNAKAVLERIIRSMNKEQP